MMKKLLRKISNLRLAAIALALVAVVCAVVWASHSLRRSSVTVGSDKKIEITPEQITAIKAIGQWEFLSVSDEELVDTVRRGFFRDDHLVRIYYGTMRFGIDLSKAKPGWLAAMGDTVVVTLPPISLLDHDFIDEARTKSFFESGRWTAADREAMYRRAYNQMLSHGFTRANIRSAENNADAQFRGMLRAMGFENIIVRFEKE